MRSLRNLIRRLKKFVQMSILKLAYLQVDVQCIIQLHVHYANSHSSDIAKFEFK